MTKNGMRAFAAGMIITCAVIAFFYYFLFSDSTNASKSASDKTITESDVESYLTKKGQIAVDQKTFNEWQDAEQGAKGEEQASNKDEEPSTTKSDDSKQTEDKKETEEKAKPKVVKITIKSGMTSTDIANELESEKIIKDSQDLVDYIVKHKLEKYIQLGSFKINSDMSISDIAKAISR